MTVQSGSVLKPVLTGVETTALRIAISFHDADEDGKCACGQRLDPHNSDAREEHLLEIAFAAGRRRVTQEIKARAKRSP